MNIGNYQFGEFSIRDNKLFYVDQLIADETLAPVLSAGSDSIYVINVSHLFLAHPFVVIVHSRVPVLYRATEVETGFRSIRFKEFGSGYEHRFRQFGPYEYPHEDSDAVKLISC